MKAKLDSFTEIVTLTMTLDELSTLKRSLFSGVLTFNGAVDNLELEDEIMLNSLKTYHSLEVSKRNRLLKDLDKCTRKFDSMEDKPNES